MKKAIALVILIILFLGLTQVNLISQNRPQSPAFQRGDRPVGEAMEIRSKMRQIEREAIQNDPELKKLDEQIKALQKKLEEKLQEKLSTNTEYQELKQKMEQQQQQWRERAKERQQTGN